MQDDMQIENGKFGQITQVSLRELKGFVWVDPHSQIGLKNISDTGIVRLGRYSLLSFIICFVIF